MNNDFCITGEAICQWFSRVTKSRVKIIGKSHHEWPKMVIHGDKCIILFLIRYFISWTHNSAKNKPSIGHSAIVAKDGIFWLRIMTSSQLLCDVTRTWGTGIVSSYSSIVLARDNWRKGDLHWWITTANIDFSPHGIHGLACKMIFINRSKFW